MSTSLNFDALMIPTHKSDDHIKMLLRIKIHQPLKYENRTRFLKISHPLHHISPVANLTQLEIYSFSGVQLWSPAQIILNFLWNFFIAVLQCLIGSVPVFYPEINVSNFNLLHTVKRYEDCHSFISQSFLCLWKLLNKNIVQGTN